MHAWFERTFGAPLSLDLGPLVQTAAACWASAPELVPSKLMVPAFPEGLERYAAIGCWGHGIGSQAFYLVRAADGHRCFLRVGFGGPYDGPASAIVAALRTYGEIVGACAESEIVYSIGTGRARLLVAGHERLFDASKLVPMGAPALAIDAFLALARDAIR